MQRYPAQKSVFNALVVALCSLWPLIRPPSGLAGDPQEFWAQAVKSHAEAEMKRREMAAEELKVLRAKMGTQQDRVRYMQRWTQVTFHDEQSLIPRANVLPRHLQRLEKQREITKTTLLEFGAQSRGAKGAIASGRALDFFLDMCGEAAFELTYAKKLRIADKTMAESAKIEDELLSGLAKNYFVGPDMIRHIKYGQGLIGPELTGRLNQTPLDLDELPPVLRQHEFAEQIDLIRSFRDHAIDELRSGKPVTAETTRGLTDALSLLKAEVKKAQIASAKQGSKAWAPYNDATIHLMMLSSGAERLVAAQRIEDVTFEYFPGGNIEDLLAYMYRNKLRFRRADPNGMSTYEQLFDLLAKYYTDLRVLRQAALDAKNELHDMKVRARELEDIELGISLSNLQKFELLNKGLDDIKAAFEAYEAQQKAK